MSGKSPGPTSGTGVAGWFAGWRPLMRIARRDALRARGRSALIVAMVALPILALTTADVLARSAQLDPTERVARELGTTQGQLQLIGRPVVQAPNPLTTGWTEPATPDNTGTPDVPPPIDPVSVAPAGYRLLTQREGRVQTRTATGIAPASWTEVAVGDKAFTGRYARVAGRAPRTDSEVAVSSKLLDRLGVQVGQDVTLTQPAITMRVTGVYDQVGQRTYQEMFWALPSSGPAIRSGVESFNGDQPIVYLDGTSPLTWDQVLALNKNGVVAASRAVLLNPPPRSAVPYFRQYGSSSGGGFSDYAFFIVLIVVVVVLAGLEVTLLAGAAFAVGARRQARTLGLLAATGGSSSHVRRVVLAGGLVLGAAGAVVGVVLGLLLAALSTGPMESLSNSEYGHFDVRPLELLAIAGLGVVTGLLSAVLPARTAARQDPVVALTGRRGQVRTAKKVPVIGVVMVIAGVAAAATGSALVVSLNTGLNPANGTSTALVAALIAGGAALAQLGLIVTSPAIIGLVGRLGSRLPLPARLAVRDAARHRGRSAPAMAAVLTAVTGSTALLLYVTSTDAHDRETYQPTWAPQTAGITLHTSRFDATANKTITTLLDPDRVTRLLAPTLPPFTATTIDATVECDSDGSCGSLSPRLFGVQDGYSTGSFSGTPVGDETTVRGITGRPSAAAADVIRRGGVVVFDRSFIRRGQVRLDVTTLADAREAARRGDDTPATTTVRLPAVLVPRGAATVPMMLSARAAKKLGFSVEPSVVLMHFDRLPTTGQQDAARGALANQGLEPYLFSVERGYQSSYGLGLLSLVLAAGVITLGASGVATGLAQADARADHATLAAVGAAPRLRRTLAAAQALTIALLGTALGIAAGFVPAVALIGAVESLHLVIPWLLLATVLLGVPLLAGALAWLLTRSRVPLERRLG